MSTATLPTTAAPLPQTRNERLENLWTELLQKSPTPEHLLSVFGSTPHLREKAWQEYAKTNPKPEALFELVKDFHGENRLYPARLIIERFPSEHNLYRLIKNAAIGSVAKLEAAEKLVAGEPENPHSHGAWMHVIQYGEDNDVKVKAAQKLLRKELSDNELTTIVHFVPSYAEEAARKITERNVSGEDVVAGRNNNNALLTVICRVPTFADKAWGLLKSRGCEYSTLEYVVLNYEKGRMEAAEILLGSAIPDVLLFSSMHVILEHCPTLRERAWEKLQQVTLSDTELKAVVRVAPEIRERALALCKPPERTATYIAHEIYLVAKDFK